MSPRNCTHSTAQDVGVLSVAGLISLDIRVSVLKSENIYTRQLAETQRISEVCYILPLYFSLYDFHNVKIQPRGFPIALCWTEMGYHTQSY